MTILFRENELIIGSTTIPENVTFRFSDILKLGGGGSQPSWQDIVLSGVGSLTLTKAKADGLNYLKLFGDTEQLPENYIDSVTLEGKCEQRNLPVGHTQLAYVNMTSGSYIKIEDLPISAGYRVEYEFQTTTLSSTLRNYLGGRVGGVSAGGGFRLSKLASGDPWLNRVALYGFESGTEYYAPEQFQPHTRYKYTYDNGVCTLESGGSVVSTQTFTITDNTSTNWGINAYVNGSNWQTESDSMYVYSLKVWNPQGELVMDLVPDLTSSNVVCFYDMVTGNVREASGGTFIAGSTAVPSPDAPMDIVCNNGTIKIKDDELPIGYKRLKDIIFDGEVYYVADTYLTGADTTTFTINATRNGRNVLGCYTGSGTGNNISFYLSTGEFGNYVRYKDNLYRPIINNSGIGQDYTLSITPTGTTGFDTNVTWTELAFTCPDKLYIGWLANATPPKFLGTFKGNITVSNRVKFIPCERVSDSAIGYYDTYSETFFENQGTGTPTTSGYDNTHNIIYTDGTVETVTDNVGNVATAERLLSVGNYKDTQEVLSGAVTRNLGIKVLDGTENWRTSITSKFYFDNDYMRNYNNMPLLCSHYKAVLAAGTSGVGFGEIGLFASATQGASSARLVIGDDNYTSVDNFKAYLSQQYANGTPVIVVYPTISATTETVTSQLLQKSPVTQTAGSISNLPIAITESSHTTPTPTQPLPINCNNGVLGIDSQGNITVTGTTETVAILKNYAETFTLSDEVPNQSGTEMRTGTILTNLPAGTYRINKSGYGYAIFVYGKVGSTKTNYIVISTDTEVTLSGTGELYIYAGNNVSVSALSNLTLEVYNTTEQTATAEMLLKVGTYQDVQSVIDGVVTRNVGILVLDGVTTGKKIGTAWNSTYKRGSFAASNMASTASGVSDALCNLFNYSSSVYGAPTTAGFCTSNGTIFFSFLGIDGVTSADTANAWFATQYANGTPVIVVYPLATPTNETVTAQPLTIQAGTNVVEITQASIDNLGLEVSYKGTV